MYFNAIQCKEIEGMYMYNNQFLQNLTTAPDILLYK